MVSARVHAALLIAVAALIALYWLAYFLTDLLAPVFVADPAAATLTAVYFGFENAFPAADAFVAAMALLAAYALRRGDAQAPVYGLLSSGGLAFLGLIDVSFNLEHGFFTQSSLARDPGMALEAAINLGCLGFAAYSAWWFAKRIENFLR